MKKHDKTAQHNQHMTQRVTRYQSVYMLDSLRDSVNHFNAGLPAWLSESL